MIETFPLEQAVDGLRSHDGRQSPVPRVAGYKRTVTDNLATDRSHATSDTVLHITGGQT